MESTFSFIRLFGLTLAAGGQDRVFGLDMQTVTQIGFLLLNVGVLAVVLSKMLYKPVRDFLQKRTDKIAAQLMQAENEMVKADELKHEYEQKLKEVDFKRDEILEEARKVAAEKSRSALSDAKKEADNIRARATAEIELERERAQADMKIAILQISATMTAKFITKVMDDDTRDRLFDETMAELGEVTWRK